MLPTTTIKSFGDLPSVLDLATLPPGPEEADTITQLPAAPSLDLGDLLARLETASGALAAATKQDQALRAGAERELAQYDALVSQQAEAERAQASATKVRLEAQALRDSAFTEAAAAQAEKTVQIAALAETEAERLVGQWRSQVERQACKPEVAQLLAERKRAAAAEKAKAAEAERARRLSGALAAAESALEAGRSEQARAVLVSLSKEYPNHAQVIALREMIAEHERLVKAAAAEAVLWSVRKDYRRAPAEALARLESLDVAGLPEPLGAQVFGAWAKACGRWCKERGLSEPLRYAPNPGRGAVIARESPDAPYVVLSALGMGTNWRKGAPVSDRQIRRARPLR